MRKLEELHDYYVQKLAPELKVLEDDRKKCLNKIIIVTVIIAPPIILAVIALIQALPRLALFTAFIGMMIWFGFYVFITKDYVSNFKTVIIEKIIKFIDPDLVYSKFNKVSQSLFKMSNIFLQGVEEYKGDDHVSGVLGKTKVEFSELRASYYTRSSKGGKTEHIIFKGLFFVADFNKNFTGRTVVLPDTAEKLLGNIGTMFQSMNKFRGQLIKLEDPEFEKLFAVYGNDQIEARYILSTSLMKRIVDFKKKTGKRLYMSFVASKLFVAIPYAKDLFEPRVFKTLLDFKPIQDYYEDLQIAISIVEDLNLNTRIWTKK
jgi:hypothetical protein